MNLYVHFPFCRSRCSYCALHSRAGSSAGARARYVESIRAELESARGRLESISVESKSPGDRPDTTLKTLYFGGGSPALCDLGELRGALAPLIGGTTEFTVELHPLDVTPAKLDELASIGVNRVSMGVQSLDDATLRAMGRGYTAAGAARAFALVKSRFDNAGIDLIIGYPGDPATENAEAVLAPLADWGLRHCSVYSLQNERGLRNVPGDDAVLDGVRSAARFLGSIGLSRYEISNYAVPGFECRHNLAVWRGEDYTGTGEGACGREGLLRTRGTASRGGVRPFETAVSRVSPEEDRKERAIFRLRTREGIDPSLFPEWRGTLERFAAEGLLVRAAGGAAYRLTDRGTEVCDSILAELV